ncbi:TetR/AcrR family transcriptional regulator [Niabella insulamsoli]|uniref:TetR/AcrR family transcriptional regulator n=1 Tax=Niabella insulamsoli TaxID=3144874 RepID=UPI0031FD4C99
MAIIIDNKARIREKAKELFIQLGLRRVSMDDIANSVGMSKKTLYQYYTDKETLVAETIEMILKSNSINCETCREKAKNAIHEGFLATASVSDMMRHMNPVLLLDMQKYYPLAYKKFLQFKEDFLYNFLRHSLEWGVRDGLFRKDIDVNFVSRLRLESIHLPFQLSFYDAMKTDLGTLQEEIFILYLYGIATPKGTKMINKYRIEKQKPFTDDNK